MSNFFSLVKVQLLGLFGINKKLNGKGKSGKGAITGVLSVLLIAACIVYLGYMYSEEYAVFLSAGGEIYKLVPLMISIASIISFVFSFYASGTVLYGYKDYQLLSAMPVKNREIVLSKLAYMYVSDLVFNLLIIVPSLFVYGSHGGEITAGFVFATLALVLFSPLLMISFSVAIGALTAYISSFFRKKYIAQIIILGSVMIALFAFSFFSGYNAAEGGNMFSSAITKLYFVYAIAEAGMKNGLYVLLFAVINAGAFAAVTVAVCYTYKKMNTLVVSKRTLKNFRLKDSEAKGQFSALLSREAKRLFTCPIYVINSFVGVVMSVVFGVLYMILMIIFSRNGLDLSVTENFTIFVPAVFSFVFFMAPATACSVSLEGKTFWIIRTMPVDMKSVFNAKLLLSYIIYSITAVVSSLIVTLSLGYSAVTVLLVTFNALTAALFSSNLGLLFNLLLPKLEWENESEVVKRSAATFLTVLAAFVFAGLFAFVGAEVINTSFPISIYLLFTGLFQLVCAFVVYIVVMEKGEKMLLRKL